MITKSIRISVSNMWKQEFANSPVEVRRKMWMCWLRTFVESVHRLTIWNVWALSWKLQKFCSSESIFRSILWNFFNSTRPDSKVGNWWAYKHQTVFKFICYWDVNLWEKRIFDFQILQDTFGSFSLNLLLEQDVLLLKCSWNSLRKKLFRA